MKRLKDCKGKAVKLLAATQFFRVLKEKVQNLGTQVLGREGRQGPNRLFFSSKHKTRTLIQINT